MSKRDYSKLAGEIPQNFRAKMRIIGGKISGNRRGNMLLQNYVSKNWQKNKRG